MIAWLHGFRPWQDKSILMEMYSGGGGSCPALRLPGAEMKEKWLLSDLLPPTDPSVPLNCAHTDNAFSLSVLKILTPASAIFLLLQLMTALVHLSFLKKCHLVLKLLCVHIIPSK